MGLYWAVLRPLLFSLPPEQSHRLTQALLRIRPLWRLLSPAFQTNDPRLACNVAGIALPNPVGLAAGYDKECETLEPLGKLGFGYLVGGTVMPEPRSGNPRPRLLRQRKKEAIVNAMGFPSHGLEAVVPRLKSLGDSPVPLVVSIAALEINGFVRCHRETEPLVEAVEVNISSPNTVGLRIFQEPDTLRALLGRLNARRQKPLFVKIPPYFDEESRELIFTLLRVVVEEGAEGVTAANTWPVKEPRLKVGAGGLSGRPLFPHMVRIVREIRQEYGPRLAINACGGIFSAQDAFHALEAGADTVQLFTALIYRGPGVVKEINTGLLRLLEKHGYASVEALRHKPRPTLL